MKGAIERVMQQCSTYQTINKENNKLVNMPLDNTFRSKMLLESQYMGSSGLRGLYLILYINYLNLYGWQWFERFVFVYIFFK